MSAWTSPAPKALISDDRKTGLIVAGVRGDDNLAQKRAKELTSTFVADANDVTVRTGGEATIYWQINEQSTKDLLLMEVLVLPLSFLVLVWVFGGLLSAALPLSIGVFAILGSMAALRATTMFTDVSIFALNLSIAMGLALATDYTLLILSRYRNEVAGGATRNAALIRTMATAGRTVLFSALTVALSMVTMLVFPQYFLKSFAYAGVIVVAFAATAAVFVTPAGIALLDERIDRFDVRTLIRRILGRPDPQPIPVEQTFWYRWTSSSCHGPCRSALPWLSSFLRSACRSWESNGDSRTTGCYPHPHLRVRWEIDAQRLRGRSVDEHQRGDPARRRVEPNRNRPVRNQIVSDRRCVSVSTIAGSWVNGNLAGPPSTPTGIEGGAVFMTVTSTAALYSDASENQLDAVHAVPTPGGGDVLLGGTAQANRDTVQNHQPPAPGARSHRRHHHHFDLPAHRERADAVQGGGAQLPVADGCVRRFGVGVPRGAPGCARRRGDGHPGGRSPGSPVLHSLWAVDGLRSVPDFPDSRALAGIRSIDRSQ